jgi:hypothetical protein
VQRRAAVTRFVLTSCLINFNEARRVIGVVLYEVMIDEKVRTGFWPRKRRDRGRQDHLGRAAADPVRCAGCLGCVRNRNWSSNSFSSSNRKTQDNNLTIATLLLQILKITHSKLCEFHYHHLYYLSLRISHLISALSTPPFFLLSRSNFPFSQQNATRFSTSLYDPQN